INAQGQRQKLPLSGASPTWQLEFSDAWKKLVLESTSPQVAFYSLTLGGYPRHTEPVASPAVEIFREYQNAEGDRVTTAAVGDVITVHVRLRARRQDFIPQVAIVDLFPTGFTLERQE